MNMPRVGYRRTTHTKEQGLSRELKAVKNSLLNYFRAKIRGKKYVPGIIKDVLTQSEFTKPASELKEISDQNRLVSDLKKEACTELKVTSIDENEIREALKFPIIEIKKIPVEIPAVSPQAQLPKSEEKPTCFYKKVQDELGQFYEDEIYIVSFGKQTHALPKFKSYVSVLRTSDGGVFLSRARFEDVIGDDYYFYVNGKTQKFNTSERGLILVSLKDLPKINLDRREKTELSNKEITQLDKNRPYLVTLGHVKLVAGYFLHSYKTSNGIAYCFDTGIVEAKVDTRDPIIATGATRSNVVNGANNYSVTKTEPKFDPAPIQEPIFFEEALKEIKVGQVIASKADKIPRKLAAKIEILLRGKSVILTQREYQTNGTLEAIEDSYVKLKTLPDKFSPTKFYFDDWYMIITPTEDLYGSVGDLQSLILEQLDNGLSCVIPKCEWEIKDKDFLQELQKRLLNKKNIMVQQKNKKTEQGEVTNLTSTSIFIKSAFSFNDGPVRITPLEPVKKISISESTLEKVEEIDLVKDDWAIQTQKLIPGQMYKVNIADTISRLLVFKSVENNKIIFTSGDYFPLPYPLKLKII